MEGQDLVVAVPVPAEQEHLPHELEVSVPQVVELVAPVQLLVRMLPCPIPEVVRPVYLHAMGHEHHHVHLDQVVEHHEQFGVDPEVGLGVSLGVD